MVLMIDRTSWSLIVIPFVGYLGPSARSEVTAHGQIQQRQDGGRGVQIGRREMSNSRAVALLI
jgi:hypothetical protein